MKANLLSAARAATVATAMVLAGFGTLASNSSAEAADLGGPAVVSPAVVMAPVPAEGVPCVFEESGPAIVLPWQSVWLGHFSGGRFVRTSTGPMLDWQDHKMCFPSRASCNRWVHGQRAYFHRPEGYTTCLMLR